MNLTLETILMLGSVISELRYIERRNLWKQFVTENQKAILAYLFISIIIVLLSQTVPVDTQLRSLLTEIAMLLFSLQTFMIVKSEVKCASVLKSIVCWAIVFNVVYCIFFEMLVGINPAGMPLYILLGVDDNQFITDMIESERGGLSFRSQTVYRHPLSLGQYMLVFLPLFLIKGKLFLKLFYTFLISCLIVLSGSRGAMAPMAFILFLAVMKDLKSHVRHIALGLFAVVISISFIPDKQWERFNKDIEPFVASLQFWDDQKQYENKIDGSSMEMRFNQFDAALTEINDNPFFGRGYSYRDYYIFKHNALHPDLLGFESVFLLHLVERGWIGLMFFFMMIYYIYKLFGKGLPNRETIKYVFMGYLLSIIMTGIRPLTLLFVCLSCSIIYGKMREGETDVLDQEPVQV